MEAHRKISLKCADGQDLQVNYDALLMSKFFYNMFEDQDMPNDTVPVSNAPLLTKANMEAVMEYCEFAYKSHPPKIQKPIKQNSIYDITSPWYAKFASKYADSQLCELILVANYLENDGLLQLLSAKLACDLKPKTVEEVRAFFGVQNDYTADEIKRLDEQKEEAKEIFELEDD